MELISTHPFLTFFADIVIGFFITKYWYSPKLDEIDEKLKGSNELDFTELFVWSFAMCVFWVFLAPFEYFTKFKRWYPKK